MAIERTPPQNMDAERSVLGAVLLNNEVLLDVTEAVHPEDFYDPKHKEIFESITNLYKHNVHVDTITVSDELEKRQSLGMVGGRVYIASLAADVPSTSNAGEYARIIAEKSMLRSLIEKGDQIVNKGYDSTATAAETLEFAESKIFEIGQRRQTKDFEHIKNILLENIDTIDRVSKLKGQLTGLTTGFKDLDDLTSGLQKSDMIIVAARPSMGKTAFALNIAQAAAVRGFANVLLFSLEMSKEQLGQRLLAMEAKIDMQKIKTGNLERKDWFQINLALDTLSKSNIFIDDTSKNIMEMRNKCRRLKSTNGLDLIMIDYLQMMNFEGHSEGRQQEITTISRYLKQLAKEMECPLVVLSQLSRAPEQREKHRPILSDLRESGAIEQDADIVIFLYRDEYYNKDTEKVGECEVIIAKNRSGPTGTIELTWLGKYTKFADKSTFRR